MNKISPTDEENRTLQESICELMKLWRSSGLSVTYKAHVLEHHVLEKQKLYGIALKDENLWKGATKLEQEMVGDWPV